MVVFCVIELRLTRAVYARVLLSRIIHRPVADFIRPAGCADARLGNRVRCQRDLAAASSLGRNYHEFCDIHCSACQGR